MKMEEITIHAADIQGNVIAYMDTLVINATNAVIHSPVFQVAQVNIMLILFSKTFIIILFPLQLFRM